MANPSSMGRIREDVSKPKYHEKYETNELRTRRDIRCTQYHLPSTDS